MNARELAAFVKSEARRLGFDDVGITVAQSPPHYEQFRAWLHCGHHAGMSYMLRHAQARKDLASVLPGVRSVVVVLKSYNDGAVPEGEGKISRYALRRDYHRAMKRRLQRLGQALSTREPAARWRAVVDTAPVLERDFAWLAGLGWLGKNTMLINRRLGSWAFIGALLTTAELEPDPPFPTDHCGTCTRCLDACPTNALVGPRQLDARRCIAYVTIEHRGPVDEAMRGQLHGWLFGCDICQEVCPWNRKAAVAAENWLEGRESLVELQDPVTVLEMEDDALAQRVAGTPLARAGVEGLKRNAALLLAQSKDQRAEEALRAAQSHPSAVVREAASWALSVRRPEPAEAAEPAPLPPQGDDSR